MLFDINYVIRGIYLIVQLLNYATHPHVIALIITARAQKSKQLCKEMQRIVVSWNFPVTHRI